MTKYYVKEYDLDEDILPAFSYRANSKEEALKLFKMMCNRIIDRFADSGKEPEVYLWIDDNDIRTVEAEISCRSKTYLVHIE